MGKTPKPLTIEIDAAMAEWAEIKALEAQGHTIWIRAWEAQRPDVVLGDHCWLMDEAHRKYLDLAVSEARRRRYPPTKKESE